VIATDLASVLLAAGAVAGSLGDLERGPRKLWRLAVPPLLALPAALLSASAAFDSVVFILSWLFVAVLGCSLGLPSGRSIPVATDQIWGTVRTARTGDGAMVAAVLLVVVTTDGLSPYLPLFGPPGGTTGLEPLRLVGALCAGYLGGRAWSLVLGAARTPHTALGVADAPFSGGD
jgi:hypothetical protein